MASKRDRVFALVMVIVFTITTVGVSGAFAWQVIQEGRNGSSSSAVTADDVQSQADPVDDKDKLKGKDMQDYTPVAKVDELKITDLEVGTGDVVKAGDTVTVDYTGALAVSGKVFESSLDSGQQATFPLDGVIKGWTEGLPGMKVGGKRRLHIPAAMAYGEQSPSADIPANSDLVFDITLHKIGK